MKYKAGDMVKCKKSHISMVGKKLLEEGKEYLVVAYDKYNVVSDSVYNGDMICIMYADCKIEQIGSYFASENTLPYTPFAMSESAIVSFPYFYDHFFTDKELRKIKLKKINILK